MQSQKDMLFSKWQDNVFLKLGMARQCSVCEKLGELGTKLWQVLAIFQLHQLESNPGSTTFGWEGCSHPASAVCSKEWRRLPWLRFFPVCVRSPWCRRMPLSTCSTNERNPERTVRRETNSGDPPGPSRMQASTSVKKSFLLIVYWPWGPWVCQPSQ